MTVSEGRITKKFLAITHRPSGIYLAVYDRKYGGAHVSYHTDGRVHFKAEGIPGPDPPVPAGEFWMGSDERDNEKPRHRVYSTRRSRYP